MSSRVFNEQIVVLSKLPYNDSTQVLRCYSNAYGAKAFFISTSKKSVLKPAMTLPLSVIDVVTTARGNGKLERIKDAQLVCQSPGALGNPIKTALVFFTTEVLEILVKEEFENTQLYQFVKQQIVDITQANTPAPIFPLAFLVGVIEQLGFLPQVNTFTQNSYFDLLEGQFSEQLPIHPAVIDKSISQHWFALLKGYQNQKYPEMSRKIRNELLEVLMRFVKLHNDHFRKLNSLAVIREIL